MSRLRGVWHCEFTAAFAAVLLISWTFLTVLLFLFFSRRIALQKSERNLSVENIKVGKMHVLSANRPLSTLTCVRCLSLDSIFSICYGNVHSVGWQIFMIISEQKWVYQ